MIALRYLLLALPALPIWLLYLLPFWALGLLRLQPWSFPVRFEVAYRWRWWRVLWEGWAGHCLPFAIVLVPDAEPAKLRHELAHHRQWLAWGPLFPVVYLALLLRHGYREHPFEIEARAAE